MKQVTSHGYMKFTICHTVSSTQNNVGQQLFVWDQLGWLNSFTQVFELEIYDSPYY